MGVPVSEHVFRSQVSGKRSCASKQALSISGAIQKGVHFLANKAVDIPASSRGPLSKPLAVDAPVQTPLVRNLHGGIVKEKGRTSNSARVSIRILIKDCKNMRLKLHMILLGYQA